MKILLSIRRYLSLLLIVLLFLPLSRCDYRADKRKSESSSTIAQQQKEFSRQDITEDYALAYKALSLPKSMSELLDLVLVTVTFLVPPLLVMASKVLPEKIISVALVLAFPIAAYFLWIAVWLPFLQPLWAGWATSIVWAYVAIVSLAHLWRLRFSSTS